jgi:hypothetical protein
MSVIAMYTSTSVCLIRDGLNSRLLSRDLHGQVVGQRSKCSKMAEIMARLQAAWATTAAPQGAGPQAAESEDRADARQQKHHERTGDHAEMEARSVVPHAVDVQKMHQAVGEAVDQGGDHGIPTQREGLLDQPRTRNSSPMGVKLMVDKAMRAKAIVGDITASIWLSWKLSRMLTHQLSGELP